MCIISMIFMVRLTVLQTRFTTDDDSHVGDDYFLDSGDKIRYFFEQDAVGTGSLYLAWYAYENLSSYRQRR
jgi:hypothetical protein